MTLEVAKVYRIRDCGVLSPKWNMCTASSSYDSGIISEEGVRRVYESKVVDDFKETVCFGHSWPDTPMESQWLQKEAQNLCQLKPDQIPAQIQEVGTKSHSMSWSCCHLLDAERGRDSLL